MSDLPRTLDPDDRHVEAVVAAAPPLASTTIDHLRTLLVPTLVRDQRATQPEATAAGEEQLAA